MDLLTSIWSFLITMVDTAPPWLPAVLLSWAVTVGVTESARQHVPPEWSKLRTHAVMQLVSMLAALAVTQALIGGEWGAVMGVTVGLWAIGAYYLAARIVRRRWPWLFDKFTWDNTL